MVDRAASISVQIKVLEHGQGLELPGYQSDGAAGMDLRAAVGPDCPLTLDVSQRAMVPTGIAIALPAGYEAQIRPRSGLAAKHGITCLNTPGTIDSDYRGEIKVILINLGQEAFTIRHGERIAQMVVAPVTRAVLQPIDSLDETVRGEGGFGSSGTR